MRVEDFSAPANVGGHAPELPDDFARRVIVKARALERRRKVRGRLAAVAVMMLFAAAIPLANRIPSRSGNLSARDPSIAAYQQDTDQAAALRLAEAASPDAVGDYLLPNTTALAEFASAYSDASWDYDPDWATSSDASTGS